MVLSRINRGVLTFVRVRCIGFSSISQAPSQIESDSHLSEKQALQEEPSKAVPLTVEAYKNQRKLRPSQPENPHLLKVAILGEPNAGKSTLTNALVKWKVCAVSRKVHTTRKQASAVLVEENKQIVFLDTPGFVTPELTKRHQLEPSFVMDPIRSLREAHLIAVVVDICNKFTNNRINEDILEALENYKHKKSILIMNKIDAMKSKGRLLGLTQTLTGGMMDGFKTENHKNIDSKQMSFDEVVALASKIPEATNSNEEANLSPADSKKGWASFSRLFMVSALKGDGIDDLRNYLLGEAVPFEWVYHDSTITDQHPHDMATMILREKLLEYLPQEIPYQLRLTISKWELLSTGCPKIQIKISCSNSRHARFVIGPAGKHIAACVEKARKAMREAFRKDVVLRVAVEQE
ncbi:hypothetical protein JTE90_017292 [Oedothorax gibbosus]|uniref:GTPase Era, mitochondrial n=1 Tax=Oedothorax gibbosus TaxID=931172 RepID=A0AAV6VE14_9ARAC|nr:hypothetical protein JTE90_017292 [Oedothorax gibbosus]